MHPVRHRRSFVIAVVAAAAAASLLAVAQPASAVILSRTGTRNTAAPSGTNSNSGWQWQGNWGGVVHRHADRAEVFHHRRSHRRRHRAERSRQREELHDRPQWDDPSTDLRIYRITGTFSSYAPIYTGSTETGKRAMIFGRGTQRGSEVKKGTTLKGWKWGYQDKVKSWGENLVSGTLNGGSGIGQLLKFTFNQQGTSGAQYNEGALSTGDSGGGVFINDGGKWKLAGINYLVDGPFSLNGVHGTGFNASVFDKGGLYHRRRWPLGVQRRHRRRHPGQFLLDAHQQPADVDQVDHRDDAGIADAVVADLPSSDCGAGAGESFDPRNRRGRAAATAPSPVADRLLQSRSSSTRRARCTTSRSTGTAATARRVSSAAFLSGIFFRPNTFCTPC